MYKVCCNCDAKIVDTGIIATCGKCNTKLVSKVLQSTIIISDKNAKENKVTVFDDVLERMVAVGKDSAWDGANTKIQFIINCKDTFLP